MFRKMMGGLFGGKKNKGNGGGGGGYGAPPPRRPPPRRPQRPGAAYGPPPPKNPNPGYGAPRPQRPPQRPLSGGYAGGQRPPVPPRRPQRPNNNNYGAPRPPPRAPPSNYGGPQSPPQPQDPDSYGAPVADPISNPDSYGAPVADPIGNPDSYGAPAADPVGPDSYGAPAADPVGPDSYGAPIADPIATYGRGQSSAPPRTPGGGSFGPGSAIKILPAPNLATEAPPGVVRDQFGQSGGPDTISAPDSYGSPQASPQQYDNNDIGSAQVQAGYIISDDTGSGPVSNIGTGSGPVVSSDNPFLQQQQYGNAAPPLPVTNNGPFGTNTGSGAVPADLAPQDPDSYGAPAGPITDIDIPEGTVVVEGRNQDVVDVAVGAGAFTTLVKIVSDLGLVDTLKGAEALTVFAPSDDAFAKLPAGTLESLTPDQAKEIVLRHVVTAKVPAAAVATGPVETIGGEVIDLIKTEAGGVQIAYEGNTINVVTADVLASNGVIHIIDKVILPATGLEGAGDALADPNLLSAPEGELTGTELGETGEESPLFENLRDVAFTSADEPATEALPALEIDLSGGSFVDLANGLDEGPDSFEVDLTNDIGPSADDLESNYDDYDQTTPSGAEYEYVGEEYVSDDYYEGDEDIPPEFPEIIEDVDVFDSTPPTEIDLRDQSEAQQEAYGDAQETYGNEKAADYYGDEYAEYEGAEYEDDEEYYYEYEDDQASGSQTTEAIPVEDGGNFISVPLMIEEVEDPAAAPVILAGTENQPAPAGAPSGPDSTAAGVDLRSQQDDVLSQYGGGQGNGIDLREDQARVARTSKRRAPNTFHHFLQQPAPQQAKRQADWSQRIETRRRNRVWRQFNLD